MIESDFPGSVSEIIQWSHERGLPLATARVRFAQRVILISIGGNPRLRDALIFKGGNALDFVWSPNRSTIDLDFSLNSEAEVSRTGHEQIRELLGRSLAAGQSRDGVMAKIQRWDIQPRNLERVRFPAVKATIG